MTEQDDFKNAIEHIHSKSLSLWRRLGDQKKTCESFKNKFISHFHIYKEKELEELLENNFLKIPNDSDGVIKGERGRILLPPLIKRHTNIFVPLLRATWDFNDNTSVDHFLSLDLWREEGNTFSLRFDRNSPGGDHDFFHLQINKDIPGIDPKHLDNISWFPYKRPCIPIHHLKLTPVSILIFICIVLYGFNPIQTLFTGASIKQSYYYGFKTLKDYYLCQETIKS